MRDRIALRLIALLQAVHRHMLRAFPATFHAEFGEEMAELFGERLTEYAKHGIRAIIHLGWQELWHMPTALLCVYLYQAQKKRRRVWQFFAQVERHSVFGVPPADNDGRFSLSQRLLELVPFAITTTLLVLLTYWPSVNWSGALNGATIYAGIVPLFVLLLGLLRGMPRWAYPYGGLAVGYLLWISAENQLIWLWTLFLITAVALAIMAVVVQRRERSLPIFWQRVGNSIVLDWTRLSFAIFGAMPLVVLIAFDNGYLNHRTPFLALSMLAVMLTAFLYCRCRRQDRQLAILLSGTTLVLLPALLDHVIGQGRWGDTGWLLVLWGWMIVLLLLPILTVPLQWRVPFHL